MAVTINRWPSQRPAQIALQNTLSSYLYREYADDDNLQALFAAYNALAQEYVVWFNTFSYPVYAMNQMISGAVLDWVAQSLYGMSRPVLASGAVSLFGPINSYNVNKIAINSFSGGGAETVYITTDDVFKRVLTWHLYDGDGKQFSIKWLKRRIMRFCYGQNGGDYLIDVTYPVSISIASGVCTIALTGVPAPFGTLFAACIAQGVLEMPPFYSYTVTVS